MKILRNSFCRAQQTTGGYGVYHYYMHQHNYYDCYYFFRYTHYFVFLLPFQMMGKDEEITYPWITIRIFSRFIMKKNVLDLNRKAFLCVQFAFPHWKKLMSFSKSLISDFHTISYWTQWFCFSFVCGRFFLPFNTDRNVFLSDKPMCLVSIA